MAMWSLCLLPTHCQFCAGVAGPEGARNGLVIEPFCSRHACVPTSYQPIALWSPWAHRSPALFLSGAAGGGGLRTAAALASFLAGWAGRTSHCSSLPLPASLEGSSRPYL